jgi:hypothetical protein
MHSVGASSEAAILSRKSNAFIRKKPTSKPSFSWNRKRHCRRKRKSKHKREIGRVRAMNTVGDEEGKEDEEEEAMNTVGDEEGKEDEEEEGK